MKPILTKHFHNKSVSQGDNVTFTCETQIDSLPIFLFYKLDQDISRIYQSKKEGFDLDKHSKSLQQQVIYYL